MNEEDEFVFVRDDDIPEMTRWDMAKKMAANPLATTRFVGEVARGFAPSWARIPSVPRMLPSVTKKPVQLEMIDMDGVPVRGRMEPFELQENYFKGLYKTRSKSKKSRSKKSRSKKSRSKKSRSKKSKSRR